MKNNLFLQLFLLHIDDIISGMADKEPHGGLLGSTSVVCDQENKVKCIYLCDIIAALEAVLKIFFYHLRKMILEVF